MKTKRIIAQLAACMLLCGTPAMGEKFSLSEVIEASKKTITYELKDPAAFERISLTGGGTVEYRQSTDGQTRVTVTMPENLREYLEVEVKDGTLRNRWKGKNVSINGDSKLKIVAESPQLEVAGVTGSGVIRLMNGLHTRRVAFKVAGSGDIEARSLDIEETLQAEVAGSGDISLINASAANLSLKIAGSGDIQAEGMEVQEANVQIAGSGDIVLKGSASKAAYKTTGSGEIHADGMKAKDVNAQVTGSGTIECHAVDKLYTKTVGSGEINYSGNPIVTSSNMKRSEKQQEAPEEDMWGL